MYLFMGARIGEGEEAGKAGDIARASVVSNKYLDIQCVACYL